MGLQDDLLLRQIHAFVRGLAAALRGGRLDVVEVRAEVTGRVGLSPTVAAALAPETVLAVLTTADGLHHGRAVLLGLGVAVEADIEADPGRAGRLRELAERLLDAGLPGLDADQRRDAVTLARSLGVAVPDP